MKKMIAVAVLVLFAISGTGFAEETYRIGVLAKRGAVKALEQWKATGDYLSSAVSGKKFEIVPLDFDKVNPAIENGEVDFFLVNSSMFVTAKVRYGASAVATMVNARQGKPLQAFGGVIITQAANEEINDLQDLKGKRFMAVEEASFGGWQMAYKEFVDVGIDPQHDFESLEFGGKHDNVVLAVMNEAVDAGTVRTDTLERMAAEGIIDMADFKVVHTQTHQGFPFVCSTRLYPEWPLAKTAKTSAEIAGAVTEALKRLDKDNPAAKAAQVIGWVDAMDYGPVEDLQKSLQIEAFAAN